MHTLLLAFQRLPEQEQECILTTHTILADLEANKTEEVQNGVNGNLSGLESIQMPKLEDNAQAADPGANASQEQQIGAEEKKLNLHSVDAAVQQRSLEGNIAELESKGTEEGQNGGDQDVRPSPNLPAPQPGSGRHATNKRQQATARARLLALENLSGTCPSHCYSCRVLD